MGHNSKAVHRIVLTFACRIYISSCPPFPHPKPFISLSCLEKIDTNCKIDKKMDFRGNNSKIGSQISLKISGYPNATSVYVWSNSIKGKVMLWRLRFRRKNICLATVTLKLRPMGNTVHARSYYRWTRTLTSP